MCNQAAALVMQGAGAANSAIGSYYGAKSKKVTLDLQANLDDINARALESTAQSTLLTGQHEEQKSQIATANLKGTQRASMAANGIDLGEGTANQILTSTDLMGTVDAATVHANAVRSAWGYRTQATTQSAQAAMSRAAGDAVNPSGAAMTSLIGSAGAVASTWYRYSKDKPTPAPASPGDGLSQGDRRKMGVY